MTALNHDNNIDDNVDKEISNFINLENPQSFFLFAGAGSGKTRSLVLALLGIRERYGDRLRRRSQRIGVITYTNAACNEIQGRLDFDALFCVSTIHSFVWSLIQGFNEDIRGWLKTNLALEISELQEKEKNGRPGTPASIGRLKSIQSKENRLRSLPSIRTFSYSPTGDNNTQDSLNHSEVMKLGAQFLKSKDVMQKILIGRFPILLIDESQDTNEQLIDAFLAVQKKFGRQFILGLFGDTMQRIFAEGKPKLADSIPADWARPAKTMNHRCPQRVVKLINKIRSQTDARSQLCRTDASAGCVRLFICSNNISDKKKCEDDIRKTMSTDASDPLWEEYANVKVLTLEHRMASQRMNFHHMFFPLYDVEDFKIGLLDGSFSAVKYFCDLVLPLVLSNRSKNLFGEAAILRKYSPILSEKELRAAGDDQLHNLKRARGAVDKVVTLLNSRIDTSFLEILRCVHSSNLFETPDILFPFAQKPNLENSENESDGGDAQSQGMLAIEEFLKSPFSQIEAYNAYVKGIATFDTHQGVKGREFPRVMVVMDDDDARGFLFSYEKLFGAKSKSKADLEHERVGEETTLDRTRRLFYVTCSRAQESLALVAYSSNPTAVAATMIANSWFDKDEIKVLG